MSTLRTSSGGRVASRRLQGRGPGTGSSKSNIDINNNNKKKKKKNSDSDSNSSKPSRGGGVASGEVPLADATLVPEEETAGGPPPPRRTSDSASRYWRHLHRRSWKMARHPGRLTDADGIHNVQSEGEAGTGWSRAGPWPTLTPTPPAPEALRAQSPGRGLAAGAGRAGRGFLGGRAARSRRTVLRLGPRAGPPRLPRRPAPRGTRQPPGPRRRAGRVAPRPPSGRRRRSTSSSAP